MTSPQLEARHMSSVTNQTSPGVDVIQDHHPPTNAEHKN
jgi:hypothetical protein